MSRIKQSLIFFLGLIAVVSLIGLVTPSSGQGQGSGNQNPLNVSVVNPASDPALVRDVGVPVRTPVQVKVNTAIRFGDHVGNQDVYTVPSGRRLVIEHVALHSTSVGAGNAVRGAVLTQVGEESYSYPFDVHAQAPVLGARFVVNHALLAFAEEGTVVTVTALIDQAVGEGHEGSFVALSGTLSGYLENVP